MKLVIVVWGTGNEEGGESVFRGGGHSVGVGAEEREVE